MLGKGLQQGRIPRLTRAGAELGWLKAAESGRPVAGTCSSQYSLLSLHTAVQVGFTDLAAENVF